MSSLLESSLTPTFRIDSVQYKLLPIIENYVRAKTVSQNKTDTIRAIGNKAIEICIFTIKYLRTLFTPRLLVTDTYFV